MGNAPKLELLMLRAQQLQTDLPEADVHDPSPSDRKGEFTGDAICAAAGGPEAVLQLKTLPTKKGRTNPSLTGPKTLLNETI
jgi:hypothetical protein